MSTFQRFTTCPSIILVVIICIAIHTGCIDEINFEVPAGLSESVVIQGRVVLGEEESFVEVNVSRLFDFSPESRQSVSIKNLILYDSNGNQMELDTRQPGKYKVILDENTPIQANVGTGYRISFETFDNRSYESSFDVLLENREPVALNLSITQTTLPDILGVFTEFDQVTLDITTDIDNTQSGGLYWDIKNIYALTDSPDPPTEPKTCYITKTVNVNEIYVLDPSELTSDRIENYELLSSLIDWRFAEGIYYEVKQYSVSNGAYDYWDAVNVLSEREGTMFDGPVGQIPTNLKNETDSKDPIFGYFFATQERIIRIKVSPDLVGPIRPFCPRPSPTMGINSCDDCLIEPQATTTKPDYWID